MAELTQVYAQVAVHTERKEGSELAKSVLRSLNKAPPIPLKKLALEIVR